MDKDPKHTPHSSPRFATRLLNTLFGAVGSLPMGVLYALSDALAWLAGSVVGYRRKVIRRNLESSFPDKTRTQLRKIEKDFYRFLADYFVETMRLGRMGRKEILRRMRFENQEEVDRDLAAGKNVSLLLGHYGNWEWISSVPLHLPEGVKGGQLYHPLESAAADEAFLKIRNRFGAYSIKMADTLPTLMAWRREKKPFMIGYIADQVPLWNGVHLFTDFLHHDTPVFTGPERLSRMLHASVYYGEVSRPKRGEYVCRYVKITDDAESLPQFELTRRYFAMLADSIRRTPHLWLWSHNRWKRDRQGFYDYFGPEQADKLLSHL